jgi:hypothetical protein
MTEVPTTKASLSLSDMTLEQLVQLSQGFGHEMERLRMQRQHLRKHIDQRLARGERTSVERGGGTDGAIRVDGNAPGAVIDVGLTT